MRALALALCLAATAAAAPNRGSHIAPRGGLSKHIPNLASGDVLLSYLPTVAASEECTGTSPTTLQGGSLTFTRASSGHCTKTDGTLVLLTANQPRIQPAGLLVEPAATNKCIRSGELDNAAWTATDLTPTADNTAAPDGTTTAELLADTAAGGFTESTTVALAGAAAIASVYVKQNSASATPAIILRDTTAGADVCTATVLATASWQRLSCLGLITNGNSHSVRVYPGGVAGDKLTYAWGAQLEVTGDGNSSGKPSSYIATAGTSVARALDNASLALPGRANRTAGCVGVTLSIITQLTVANQRFLDFDDSNPMYHNTNIQAVADDGSDFSGTVALASTYANTNRITYNWTGVRQYLQTGALTGADGIYDGTLWTAATLFLGENSGATNHVYASLSDIKVGITPGACL